MRKFCLSKYKRNSQSGFTLIELLVVISILVLLASISLVYMNSVRQDARDAKRVADIAQVSKALELYADSTGSYPVGTYYSAWDSTNYPSSNAKCWCKDSSTQDGLETALVGGGVLSALPHDPVNKEGAVGSYLYDGAAAGYVYISDGRSYLLGASLETVSASPPTSDQASLCMAAGNYQMAAGYLASSTCPTVNTAVNCGPRTPGFRGCAPPPSGPIQYR